MHTDKKTGIQFVSVKTWLSLMAARQALDAGFSKIEWEELKEPWPAPGSEDTELGVLWDRR